MLKEKAGVIAGQIWEALNGTEGKTQKQLKKEAKLKADKDLFLGLGWLLREDKIENWHHLHVWAVSTTENAATVHVVIKDVSQMNDIKQQIKHALAVKGISHSTIEFEFQGCPCCDKENGCFEN